MEKIKLGSGKELEIIACGILSDSQKVTIKFLPGTNSLDTVNTVLSNKAETSQMKLLSEGGETLAIYSGFTQLQSISLETDAVIGYTQDEEREAITGKLVTAVLRKPDEVSVRLDSLESQLTDTQMALCGLYEGMV